MEAVHRRLAAPARTYLLTRLRAVAKNIDLERQRQAVATTARFVDTDMSTAKALHVTDPAAAVLEILRDALARVTVEGLTVEFGVATGNTMREITQHRTPAYGFDSFQGLPEHWWTGFDAGTFAQQEVPVVPGAEMVVGLFDDTLPGFLEAHPEPFAFVHMDADLYSSTNTIFTLARDRFVPGTVITFNEYFNYPGWEQHEHRAFQEFLADYPGGHTFVNYNALSEQATAILT